MGHKILSTGLVVVAVCVVSSGIFGTRGVQAATPLTAPPNFSPKSGVVGTIVRIKGTNLANATSVSFDRTIATILSDSSRKITVEVPVGAMTGRIKVKTPAGTARSTANFTVEPPLSGSTAVVGDGSRGYCAVLSSGGVDCWGYGQNGQLGNGVIYTNGSATPVEVVGESGIGTLSGVASLASADGDGDEFGSYCAVLVSGDMDCWGYGRFGELGNGFFYNGAPPNGSATPVAVEGIGGTGTLTGVENVVGLGTSYCALLISGSVDCWGQGGLGDGTFDDSATPVAVEGVGGTGILEDVRALFGGGNGAYCALLTSGAVDCWGDGYYGQLGDGTFYTTGNDGSATPVVVEGIGGSGALEGVTSLLGSSVGFCAVLTSGEVDCWGNGYFGELGDGTFYTTGNEGSASPVAVDGVGGAGVLEGVTTLWDDGDGFYGAYCASLTSGAVDCWGNGNSGALGDGTFYTTGNDGSATPVVVEGIGGSGNLSGVTASLGLGNGSFCAVLASSGVDCWGSGQYGDLGDGTNDQSATPVEVEGLDGIGALTGATSVNNNGSSSYCTLLTSSGVDCWGLGINGQLGDGTFYTSGIDGNASPVEVAGVS